MTSVVWIPFGFVLLVLGPTMLALRVARGLRADRLTVAMLACGFVLLTAVVVILGLGAAGHATRPYVVGAYVLVAVVGFAANGRGRLPLWRPRLHRVWPIAAIVALFAAAALVSVTSAHTRRAEFSEAGFIPAAPNVRPIAVRIGNRTSRNMSYTVTWSAPGLLDHTSLLRLSVGRTADAPVPTDYAESSRLQVRVLWPGGSVALRWRQPLTGPRPASSPS